MKLLLEKRPKLKLETKLAIELELAKLTVDYPFLNDWSLSFDSARKRAGACWPRLKRITLSIHHVDNNATLEIIDTLKHEIAHAICIETHGKLDHGKEWKRIAIHLGAVPKAKGDFNLPKAPWTLVILDSENNKLIKLGSYFRRNKNIKKYSLKGKPETTGKLFYLSSKEYESFSDGDTSLAKLLTNKV